jgi:hypothetical protein
MFWAATNYKSKLEDRFLNEDELAKNKLVELLV